MSSSQRKRYRDRDRYLRMTQDQREAYLQRNREYKRMRRDCGASCSNTKTTPRKINSRTKNIIYTTGDFAKSIKGTVLILLWPQDVHLCFYKYCVIL
jgi:hypothetical protein